MCAQNSGGKKHFCGLTAYFGEGGEAKIISLSQTVFWERAVCVTGVELMKKKGRGQENPKKKKRSPAAPLCWISLGKSGGGCRGRNGSLYPRRRPLHPFMAQGVLPRAGGYITSLNKKTERRNASSPAHKKSIQKMRQGGGKICCEKSSTEGGEEVVWVQELSSLQTNCAHWLRVILYGDRGFGEPVKGERKKSDVGCRSRHILGLHLAANTR